MQLTKAIGLTSWVMSVSLTQSVLAQDKATVSEVMDKVQQAAKVLQDNPNATLAEFLYPDGTWNPKNKWVWKDTYVFVFDCRADKMLAHPFLMGQAILDVKDKNGKFLLRDLCKAAERKSGGWVSYIWPHIDGSALSQKISFAMAVIGTSWQVSAGIYADDKVVEEYELRDKK